VQINVLLFREEIFEDASAIIASADAEFLRLLAAQAVIGHAKSQVAVLNHRLHAAGHIKAVALPHRNRHSQSERLGRSKKGGSEHDDEHRRKPGDHSHRKSPDAFARKKLITAS
jgi:hypothetical protein